MEATLSTHDRLSVGGEVANHPKAAKRFTWGHLARSSRPPPQLSYDYSYICTRV